jgi:uncharacterized membrane protein
LDKWLYRISIALVAIGLAVSVYMTVYKYTENSAMCLGSGDCSVVNASRYSEFYGIPVAVIGIGGYAALLAALALEARNAFFKQNGTLLVFGMSLTAFLFTIYLVYLEIWILKAFCPFCITSQVAMTAMFVLSIIRLVRQPTYH